MNFLLDTHALIWFINGDNSLSEKSKELIKNLENNCFISIASIWEIAIKLSLGKLELLCEFNEISKLINLYKIEILPISFEHIECLINLEFHHRDPFDRLIIAQGIIENLTILTKDENFRKYKAITLWN